MGCLTILQLLTIAMLFCSSPAFIHGTTEYYVVPIEDNHVIPCPGEPCHTLNHYASNTPDYTWSDIVVRFLPGNHTLNQSFHVSNISNLQLTSTTSVDIGSVSIHCISEGNFHFKHTSNTTIVGLLFFFEPMVRYHSGTLMLDNAINFRIHRIIVHNLGQFGHSVHIQKGFGKSTISHSEF